jgi:DNA repair exonuclease SbcCD nuclease subunit
VTENGIDVSFFDGVDFVIAGHIHKYQELKDDNVSVVYCSSIKQKDFGETVTGHGFVLWDVQKKKHKLVPIENNDSGFFKFSIEDVDDITNDKEVLLNW